MYILEISAGGDERRGADVSLAWIQTGGLHHR